MAQVTGLLIEGKPIVDITLADATPRPGTVTAQPAAQPFNVTPYRALLDTGADISCVCDHVVHERRLRAYGFERMIGANGPSLHTTYIVRIGIVCGDQTDATGPKTLYQLEPVEACAIRDNRWFDVIIGTDILRQHEFALTKGGGFRLTLG